MNKISAELLAEFVVKDISNFLEDHQRNIESAEGYRKIGLDEMASWHEGKASYAKMAAELLESSLKLAMGRG